MTFQQQHLPKDRDANETQEWGWTLEDFISENLWYLLALAFLLFIFFFARYRWAKRNRK